MLVSAGHGGLLGMFDLNTYQTELFFTAHSHGEDAHCVMGFVVLEDGKMVTVTQTGEFLHPGKGPWRNWLRLWNVEEGTASLLEEGGCNINIVVEVVGLEPGKFAVLLIKEEKEVIQIISVK